MNKKEIVLTGQENNLPHFAIFLMEFRDHCGSYWPGLPFSFL